jgi:hypothetical protein
MLVVDREKEQVKSWLSADIKNNISRLTDKTSQINVVISRIDYTLGGSRASSDRLLTDVCRKALFEINAAIESLHTALAHVSALDIYVEVDDG